MKKIGMLVAVEVQSVMRKQLISSKEKTSEGLKFIRLHLMIKFYILHSRVQEKSELLPVRKLISLFDVDLIVNYGVVGALTEELKVTNICLVEKVIHYDMDTSAADHCEVGRYLEYQDIYLPTTKKYVQLVIILETSQRFPMKITIGIYHKLS